MSKFVVLTIGLRSRSKVWWNGKNGFDSSFFMESLFIYIYLRKSIRLNWEQNMFTHEEMAMEILFAPLGSNFFVLKIGLLYASFLQTGHVSEDQKRLLLKIGYMNFKKKKIYLISKYKILSKYSNCVKWLSIDKWLFQHNWAPNQDQYWFSQIAFPAKVKIVILGLIATWFKWERSVSA